MAVGWIIALIVAAGLGGCAGDSSGIVAGGGVGLDQIQNEIFTPTCATAGCHDALIQAGGLDLSSADDSYNGMVGVASTCAGRIHVVAGDSATSYLLDKLGDGLAPCGALMPLALPALTADELQLIRDWIDDGAPPADPEALRATASTSTTLGREPIVIVVP